MLPWLIVFSDRGKGRPEDRRGESNSRSGGNGGGGDEKSEDESVVKESTSTEEEMPMELDEDDGERADEYREDAG